MTRLLPILVLVILGVGVFVVASYQRGLRTQTSALVQNPSPSTAPNQSTPSANLSTESRIDKLERSVSDLKIRVSTLEDDKQVPAGSRLPVYIPLGIGGHTTSIEWVISNALEVTLNPADYPGSTSVQVEVSLKVNDKNSRGYVRLINYTDNSPLVDSEISTNSDSYTWITSNKFNLSPGSKVYRFQLKSQNGVEVSIEDSRIKINFN